MDDKFHLQLAWKLKLETWIEWYLTKKNQLINS